MSESNSNTDPLLSQHHVHMSPEVVRDMFDASQLPTGALNESQSTQQDSHGFSQNFDVIQSTLDGAFASLEEPPDNEAETLGTHPTDPEEVSIPPLSADLGRRRTNFLWTQANNRVTQVEGATRPRIHGRRSYITSCRIYANNKNRKQQQSDKVFYARRKLIADYDLFILPQYRHHFEHSYDTI